MGRQGKNMMQACMLYCACCSVHGSAGSLVTICTDPPYALVHVTHRIARLMCLVLALPEQYKM